MRCGKQLFIHPNTTPADNLADGSLKCVCHVIALAFVHQMLCAVSGHVVGTPGWGIAG